MALDFEADVDIQRLSLPVTIQCKSDDLWQEALESLGSELRSILTINQHRDRRVILESVLFEAREKRKQCLAKRWKIMKRNGDIIVLRDVFEKIIKWVDKFKAVGDAAINSAPTYASIPWGVVSMLIKSSINDNEIFAAMIDGLERVTNVMARYAIFEDVYLRQQTMASNHLKSSMIALYASILTFLARSYKYFGQNTAKRMVKSALGQSSSDIQEPLDEVEKRQVEVDRTAQLVGMEILHMTSTGMGSLNNTTGRMASQLELLSSSLVALQQGQVKVQDTFTMREAIDSIMGPTQRLLERLHRYDDFLTRESRDDIFDWLSPVRYRVHHLTERQDRLLESGQWLFQSEMFRSWQNSSISGTLWLHGMPGCGKSKLASAVIDDELKRRAVSKSTDSEPAPIAYFYCSRNKAEPERSDPQEILRCIARQLCGDDPTRTVNESLFHAYSKMEKPRPGKSKLLLDHTVSLILQVLGDNPGTIIIDALDECDPEKRYILFESLDTIVKQSPNVVKVFLTSRNDGDIVCRLRTTPNIYIDAQKNKSDIQRFISSEVEKAVAQRRMLNGAVSKELQMRISMALDQGARGMFRWVSLQIQNLCDPRRMKIEEDILHELFHLPQSLQDLYSLVFDQIFELGHSSYQLALSSLQLLMAAVRPINWQEFLFLLSCSKTIIGRQPLKSEILDITCNFLEDDKVEDRPRLVHLSAREYLESRPEFLPDVSNMTAALACLGSLSIQGPFVAEVYTYPTLYLGNHLAATTRTQRTESRDLLLQFLISEPENFQFHSTDHLIVRRVQFLPKLFGVWRGRIRELLHSRLLSTDTADSAEMCQVSMVSTQPLLAVCAMGLEDLISALPSLRAESKSEVVSDFPNLSWRGQEAMNQYKNRTCMELAVMFNRPRVLQQLCALGLSLNIYTFEQETLLHLAAKLGHAEVVDVLLSCGVNPNLLSGSGTKTPLPFPTIFPLPQSNPLEHSAKSSPLSPPIAARPQTALGFRTYYGGKSGVYSPFYVNQEAKAAIHLAAERENCISTLETLIRHGANVNIRTSNSNTTLQLALEAGKSTNQIFSILLKAGTKPNDRLDQGQTILHLVAAMGLDEMVRILLASGADELIKDAFGQTPGELALRYGHTGTAKLLGVVAPPSQPLTGNLQPPRQGNARRVKSNGDVPAIMVDDSSTQLGEVVYVQNYKKEAAHRLSFKRSVMAEWSKLKTGSKR
ncbi:hypothetical protein B7463_g9416, partial [Scytalidium lignicola]